MVLAIFEIIEEGLHCRIGNKLDRTIESILHSLAIVHEDLATLRGQLILDQCRTENSVRIHLDGPGEVSVLARAPHMHPGVHEGLRVQPGGGQGACVSQSSIQSTKGYSHELSDIHLSIAIKRLTIAGKDPCSQASLEPHDVHFVAVAPRHAIAKKAVGIAPQCYSFRNGSRACGRRRSSALEDAAASPAAAAGPQKSRRRAECCGSSPPQQQQQWQLQPAAGAAALAPAPVLGAGVGGGGRGGAVARGGGASRKARTIISSGV
mmetsp:Transcript_66431/g.138736  ORF Transcript_66431/g.138736 Transcript_66431/m.138736 type:complete len:264 (+) Transcript_66431:828-1619(+)